MKYELIRNTQRGEHGLYDVGTRLPLRGRQGDRGRSQHIGRHERAGKDRLIMNVIERYEAALKAIAGFMGARENKDLTFSEAVERMGAIARNTLGEVKNMSTTAALDNLSK